MWGGGGESKGGWADSESETQAHCCRGRLRGGVVRKIVVAWLGAERGSSVDVTVVGRRR
jgi:hypothetical protein